MHAFHSLFFHSWLKLKLSTKCCYLNQYIPHYRIMNISSARLLLQMNNLTLLYQSGLGVQLVPWSLSFYTQPLIMKLFKTQYNPGKKVQDQVQRLFFLKMPGSQFKPLTAKVSSAPISHDIYIVLRAFLFIIMSSMHG